MGEDESREGRDHVQATLAAQLADIVENEPGTRLGKDPECLHRMRVATRRARSALRVAGPLFEDKWSASLRAELSWLGESWWCPRPRRSQRPPSFRMRDARGGRSRCFATRLLRPLGRAQEGARALTRALNGKRYASLLARLEEAATSPPLGENGVALDARAAKEFDKLTKSMKRLGSEPTDEELHHARIRGKRARAAELAAEVAPRPPESFIEKAKAFQDVVGVHQDAVVAEESFACSPTETALPLQRAGWSSASASVSAWRVWSCLAPGNASSGPEEDLALSEAVRQPAVAGARCGAWAQGPARSSPEYDDWSFPKGKAKAGETDEACALREVEEETGLLCELGHRSRPFRTGRRAVRSGSVAGSCDRSPASSRRTTRSTRPRGSISPRPGSV